MFAMGGISQALGGYAAANTGRYGNSRGQDVTLETPPVVVTPHGPLGGMLGALGGARGPGLDPQKAGYFLDTNRDGKYARGKEEVLAFDLNRDGKIDRAEVAQSRKILMALEGNCDFNCDGKVDAAERKEAADARRTGLAFDKDGDGKLMQGELISAGARLWGDKNRDGKIDAGEVRGTGVVGLDVLTGDVYFGGVKQ